MQNFIQSGKVIEHTVAGDAVSSGDPVEIGGFVGVAVTDGAVGDVIAVDLEGVFELPKVTGTAFTVGADLYLNSSGQLTTTPTDNALAGKCWAAAASADTLAQVRLDN